MKFEEMMELSRSTSIKNAEHIIKVVNEMKEFIKNGDEWQVAKGGLYINLVLYFMLNQATVDAKNIFDSLENQLDEHFFKNKDDSKMH